MAAIVVAIVPNLVITTAARGFFLPCFDHECADFLSQIFYAGKASSRVCQHSSRWFGIGTFENPGTGSNEIHSLRLIFSPNGRKPLHTAAFALACPWNNN